MLLQKPQNDGKRWTAEEETALRKVHDTGIFNGKAYADVEDALVHFSRSLKRSDTAGASRLKHLDGKDPADSKKDRDEAVKQLHQLFVDYLDSDNKREMSFDETLEAMYRHRLSDSDNRFWPAFRGRTGTRSQARVLVVLKQRIKELMRKRPDDIYVILSISGGVVIERRVGFAKPEPVVQAAVGSHAIVADDIYEQLRSLKDQVGLLTDLILNKARQ